MDRMIDTCRTMVAGALVLTFPLSAGAEDLQSEANALLLQTEKTAISTSYRTAPPFHEQVAFTAFGLLKGNATGEFVRDFASKEQWRYKYVLGDYQHIEVRNGHQVGEWKSSSFEPMRIEQLRGALPPVVVRFDSSDIIKKISKTTFNRAEVHCIEYETIRGKQRRTGEICVNSAQGTLARWRRGEIESEWTDYAPFGDMLYPRHLVVKENGNRTLEADIQVYAAPDLSPAIFQIPTGMEIREACEHITRPVRIAGDDPIYPYRLGKFRSVGTVVVQLRIGIEGRVEKAQIIQTAGSDLDDAAMEAVKKWVFEPAKCDGKPIPQRVDVQVNFKR